MHFVGHRFRVRRFRILSQSCFVCLCGGAFITSQDGAHVYFRGQRVNNETRFTNGCYTDIKIVYGFEMEMIRLCGVSKMAPLISLYQMCNRLNNHFPDT
jgi:hypothetical protein